MITILISSDEVVYDIQSKTHTELAVAVPDEAQRYKIEAGTEKLDEIKRCVQEAYSEVTGALVRWLDNSDSHDNVTSLYPNASVVLPENLDFRFRWSERRYRDKIDPLTSLLFSLIVNLAMVRFYTSMQAEALAKVRASQAQGDLSQVQALVFYKGEPVITHVTP